MQLFSNNAVSTLSTGIDSVTTTIALTSGALFQNPTGGDFEMITVSGSNGTEIMKVTSRATDTLIVVRAQEGTVGLTFTTGESVEARVTAGTLSSLSSSFDPNTSKIEIGFGSDASGEDSTAVGKYATVHTASIGGVAVGDSAEAKELGGVAVGPDAVSNSLDSVTLGRNAIVALGADKSIAVGPNSLAWGMESVAIGDGANVSSGKNYSVVVGGSSASQGIKGTVVGYASGVYGDNSTAVGEEAYCYDFDSLALGKGAVASNPNTTAIGVNAQARVPNTHVINGPSIVRKDNNETAGTESLNFVGQENYQFSKEVDLTQAIVDELVSIAYPLGSKFFVTELGLVITGASGVTVQPQISFGIIGSTGLLLTTTVTTAAATGEREAFTPLNINGQQSLTMSLKVSATATTMNARVYFKGFLLEEE